MKKYKILFLSVILLGFLTSCTFHRPVQIQYTPLIQTKKLANPENPQVIVMGEFADERERKELLSKHLNPISVHKMQLNISGDLPAVVRDAFTDGVLKAGFQVPMEDEEATEPFLYVSGRIIMYNLKVKTGWSKATMDAIVEVELILTDRIGYETVVNAQAIHTMEGGSIGFESAGPALSEALKKCVQSFLGDESFLALLN